MYENSITRRPLRNPMPPLAMEDEGPMLGDPALDEMPSTDEEYVYRAALEMERSMAARSRARAAADAEEAPIRQQEERVNKTLKGGKSKIKSLDKLKEKVEAARKPKMRVVEQYMCDSCDKIIPLSSTGINEGFVVQGNIYIANPSIRGGLVGDNFPEVPPGEKIDIAAVRETVFCRECMLKALGVLPASPPKLFKPPYPQKAEPSRNRGILGDPNVGQEISNMISREPRQRRWTDRDVEAAQRQAVDAGDAARYAGLGMHSPRRHSPGQEASDDYSLPDGMA